ncbi:MAG: hypothetical protein MAG551_02646 [Candidatus Scalindua arabica]|uniref:Response regulatory domain-containing protein n=1 Tax=Candidatus Scalindua arabica TaxID=1127984 RepID=A0A942A289_9BACT|nr:hypothetical protein [Candidatus Scalindua arabica]
MKVLIVDDNPKALAIAKARLKKEMLEILCVEDGKRCVEIARKEKPDLICWMWTCRIYPVLKCVRP